MNLIKGDEVWFLSEYDWFRAIVQTTPKANSKTVKLTERGKQIHREEWDRLFGDKFGFIYTPPREDENGYSRWQMWSLMQTFGEHMVLGCDCPFETDILIEFKWSE